MPVQGGYIDLRRVLKDYLQEEDVTLQDLLSVMDEDKKSIIQALRERIHLTKDQCEILERKLTSKELNLLLFVIQAFYLLNPSGVYKGRIIQPAREDVVWGEKATFEGCIQILAALRISTQGLDVGNRL